MLVCQSCLTVSGQLPWWKLLPTVPPALNPHNNYYWDGLVAELNDTTIFHTFSLFSPHNTNENMSDATARRIIRLVAIKKIIEVIILKYLFSFSKLQLSTIEGCYDDVIQCLLITTSSSHKLETYLTNRNCNVVIGYIIEHLVFTLNIMG